MILCVQFAIRNSQFDIESNSKPVNQPRPLHVRYSIEMIIMKFCKHILCGNFREFMTSN